MENKLSEQIKKGKDKLPSELRLILRVMKNKVNNILKKGSLEGVTDMSRHLKDIRTDKLIYLASEIINSLKLEGIYDRDGIKIKSEILIKTDKYESKKESFLKPFYDEGSAILILNKVLELVNDSSYINLDESNLSINMHPSDFLNNNFLGLIEKHFDKNKDYSNIIFEILEEEIPESSEAGFMAILEQLKNNYGFKFALDDFGSGSTDINRVIKLEEHIDYIKIDWKYFHESIDDIESQAYIELKDEITHFKRLGISVIVEGVETVKQYELAKKLGGDLFQGWLFKEEK